MTSVAVGRRGVGHLRAFSGAVLLLCACCAAGCTERSAVSTAASRAPTLSDRAAAGELWLSQTGLYADTSGKRLASGLIPFTPAYALWSDGAQKQRWLRLPASERIDSHDMDHWRFPSGTMLFKEFAIGGRRIETRVIARDPNGAQDDFMGAFVWNEDGTDARFEPRGMPDVFGTGHDVPSAASCATCHAGEPGRVLGFSAVQQPQASAELLSVPIAEPFEPPGGATQAAALGYLHANCGHCHNPSGSARPDTDLNLRLSVGERTLQATGAYRTAVRRPLQSFRDAARRMRIAPGDPAASALLFRMQQRGTRAQMPPLGTHSVDDAGSAAVRAFIGALAL